MNGQENKKCQGEMRFSLADVLLLYVELFLFYEKRHYLNLPIFLFVFQQFLNNVLYCLLPL